MTGRSFSGALGLAARRDRRQHLQRLRRLARAEGDAGRARDALVAAEEAVAAARRTAGFDDVV